MRHIIFALLFSISSTWAVAQSRPIELADGAPDRYIVVPGDTLWSIAGKFLKDPYRWGELWRMNQDDLRNPHRIYPGQVVVLDKSNATPHLTLETIKMQPHQYVEPLKKEISSIPPQAIEPFLTEPLVLDQNVLDPAARIIAIQDGRVIAGAGDRVFVTNVKQVVRDWQVFRAGKPMVDPDSNEVLGHEAIYLGRAQLTREGDPAEFQLRASTQEIDIGDHLLPAPHSDVISYIPRAPEKQILGRIIGVKGGVNYAGRNSVVAINRGKADGVELGHVFAAELAGKAVENRFKGEKQTFQLPDQKNGLIFVFRVFNRVSYALVMNSTKPVSLGDSIRTP